MELDTKVIETELVKANITDQVIARMKTDYMPLKVKDTYDKVGFEAVTTARKEVKKFRVLCEKTLKAVREPAVAFQKSVIAKEKEVVAKISEIEDYLISQEEVMNPKEVTPESSDEEKVDSYIKKIKAVPVPEITEEIEKARLERITKLIAQI